MSENNNDFRDTIRAASSKEPEAASPDGIMFTQEEAEKIINIINSKLNNLNGDNEIARANLEGIKAEVISNTRPDEFRRGLTGMLSPKAANTEKSGDERE